MARKRNLINDDNIASDNSQTSKRQRGDGEDGSTTKRGSRSKNFKVPNQTASQRGTMSAKAQGKKVSKQKVITETFIPMVEPSDGNHERVVFIDNDTKEPVYALYRKTEEAEPMAHLWAEFLQHIQSARDQIGADALMTFLTAEEIAAIDLKNNAHIFPTLITRAGALRSKDNLDAATTSARNAGGKFGGTATVTDADILRSRATSMRKKALALNKQAEAYEKQADQMEPTQNAPEETPLAKVGMMYIGDTLSLNRKEFNKFILDHEEHLTVTAEKLRSEMATLAAFVHKAEKRLRDDIQLKIAADYKLCRDIKLFGKFEVKGWQMGALPIGAHICWCDQCTGGTGPTGDVNKVALKYPPDSELPQLGREDALPEIKEPDEVGTPLSRATEQHTLTDTGSVSLFPSDEVRAGDEIEDSDAVKDSENSTGGNSLAVEASASASATAIEGDIENAENSKNHEVMMEEERTAGASPKSATATATNQGDQEHGEQEHGEQEHGEQEHGEQEHGEQEHGEDGEKEDGGHENDEQKSATATATNQGDQEHGEQEHGEDGEKEDGGHENDEQKSATATATNQGDQEHGEQEDSEDDEKEDGGHENDEQEDSEDGENDSATATEAELQRHNSAALDRIAQQNAILYPRLVGVPGTGHRRAGLWSDLWNDAEEMEWNAGYDL